VIVPTDLPLLARVSNGVSVETLEELLASMKARVGDFHLVLDEHPETTRDGWLACRTGPGTPQRHVRYSIPDALRTLLTQDAESTAIGIGRTIRAALDPARRIDHRTSESRLGQLVAAAFSEIVPTPHGTVDTVEVLLPNPWSGMIAARMRMPPFSSGVTSMDGAFRTVHAVPELTARVDAAIAPTALVNPAIALNSRTVHIVGGMVGLHRRVSPPDAMERLRQMVDLEKALERGIVPLPPQGSAS
jgi:hypothetical protein